MRPPGRLDTIDEADESRPLLESAPPMPSSKIDRRSGAASASISQRISAVVRGCFGDNVIGCRCSPVDSSDPRTMAAIGSFSALSSGGTSLSPVRCCSMR